MVEHKLSRSFWQRPEGKTGALVLALLLAVFVFGVANLWPIISGIISTGFGLAVIIMALGVVLYLALDPKMRNLIWYFYKKSMRWLTGLFVKIDPISILKAYISDLKVNVKKMHRQIAQLRGQMHQLQEIIYNNNKNIQANIEQASEARQRDKRNVMILKSRKAGRLRESNMRLEDMYNRMEILYRVLRRMYENSEILLEDLKDQVYLKEQERKAILASHTAMRSAMDVVKGDGDKREMFDRALEAVADDVSQKVGEMEEFMLMSEDFMNSIDIQNGIFEDKGLKLLEKWEQETDSLLLGDEKINVLLSASDNNDVLDLNKPVKKPIREENHRNQYDSFFD